MATSITYNTNDLNTTNIITSSVDDSSAPIKNLQVFNIPDTGGGTITDTAYYTKPITVEGLLKSTTVEDLEALIDTFHSYFHVKDKNLDIGYASGTRRYVCTAEEVIIERPVRGANWANFKVKFIATEYGQDTTNTNLLTNQSQTYAPYTYALSFTGSAPEQRPIIEITLTAITPSATNFVSVRNDTSTQELVITDTFADGDVLLIDCENFAVTKNGDPVDYTGAFPVFESGTHDLIIDSDFVVTDTYTTNGTWTAPTGITSATVKAWGGGASGEGKTANGGGAGGGGGAYAEKVVTVVPATGYAVAIGAGGVGTTGAIAAGGDTTFASTTVVAKGAASQTGGLSSTSVGDTVFAGGDGGNGGVAGTAGGGGGESGSDIGAGNNGTAASGTTGGAGGTGNDNSGDGGAGRSTTEGAGSAGSTAGGGGGGAYRTAANQNGGDGARGELTVTYSSFTFSIDVYYKKKYL